MTTSIDHSNVSAASLSEMVSHLLRSPISHPVEDGNDHQKAGAPLRASQSSQSLHANLPQQRQNEQYGMYSAPSHQPLQAASHCIQLQSTSERSIRIICSPGAESQPSAILWRQC